MERFSESYVVLDFWFDHTVKFKRMFHKKVHSFLKRKYNKPKGDKKCNFELGNLDGPLMKFCDLKKLKMVVL